MGLIGAVLGLSWCLLGAILGPSWGLVGSLGSTFRASPSNVFIEQKTHAVSKCKHRSRSALVQRKRFSNVYLGAILGRSWGHLGAISGHLGSILVTSWGNLKAILGPCGPPGVHFGASSSNVFIEQKNAFLIEMQMSLSLCPCAAKTLVCKKKIQSDIEITHFVEMLKSLSLGPCASKSLDVVLTGAMGPISLSQILNITQVL